MTNMPVKVRRNAWAGLWRQSWPIHRDCAWGSVRLSEDVVEAIGRHDHSEVVVLGGRPTCFPVGPIVVAFALEELTSALLRRRVEQDPNVEDVVQLRSSAVCAFEDDNVGRRHRHRGGSRGT